MYKHIRSFLISAMIVLCGTAPTLYAQSSLPPESLPAFDTVVAREHLEYLASDAMRGRNTPSPELEKAAEYISDTFEEAEVEKVSGSHFAQYDLQLHDLQLPTTLTFVRGKDTMFCVPRTDFVPFDFTGSSTITDARVVSVGYGITAPEFDHDDYKGLDVKGAVVLVIRGMPNVRDTTKGFRGRQGRFASSRDKVRNAREHGAIGVLIVDSPAFVRGNRQPSAQAHAVPTPSQVTPPQTTPTLLPAPLVPRGHSWPSLFPDLPSAEKSVTLAGPNRTEAALHVGGRVASWLFDSLSVFYHYVFAMDSTAIVNSFELAGVRMSCRVQLQSETVRVPNVVGMVRGSEYPDEYVVVGAHFDHVGVDRSGKNADSVYNGADDNASGVSALLMAANALSRAKQKPKRSVLFIAFSGEEKGLFGSEAYVAKPLLPLAQCVAMINMDMVGRCESQKLSIGGSTRCPDLAELNVTENARSIRPFSLSYDIEQYFFRSDQANFAKHKIPVLFYFTGEHSDYHQVGDESSKINYTGLTDIARIATGVVWQAANRPRTTYVEKP